MDSKRFTGDPVKDSYTFEHHNLRKIKLSIDTQSELRDYININFDNANFHEGYLSLLETQSVYNSKGKSLALTPEQYVGGSTIFMFDLTKASSGTVGDTFQPIQRGNLRLHVEFKESTAQALIAYFAFFFDSQILISADRQIIYDYNT